MPKRVFISYRRQDTAPAAGRVYDRLCQLLSKHNVFFDVSTIAGGKGFMTEVAAAVQKSDAVLVFGREIPGPTAEGIVRLLEAEDHVRAESAPRRSKGRNRWYHGDLGGQGRRTASSYPRTYAPSAPKYPASSARG